MRRFGNIGTLIKWITLVLCFYFSYIFATKDVDIAVSQNIMNFRIYFGVLVVGGVVSSFFVRDIVLKTLDNEKLILDESVEKDLPLYGKQSIFGTILIILSFILTIIFPLFFTLHAEHMFVFCLVMRLLSFLAILHCINNVIYIIALNIDYKLACKNII